MSLPEVLLWEQLRGHKLGVKFRKSRPVGPYVADFYCSSSRLVVEVDGAAHERGRAQEFDAERDRFMRENGYRVLRLTASDVLKNLDGALIAITAYVERPLHHPLDGPPPRAGEE